MRPAAPLSLALLLTLSSPVFAAVRPILWLHGGWGSYEMSDVNRDISSINSLIASTGLQMHQINNGLGFGAGAGVELIGGSSLVVGYDRLSAESDVGDPTGSIKYSLPANVFSLRGEYVFPGGSGFRPHVGGSLGLISEAGTVSVSATGSGTVNGGLTGSGGSIDFYGGGSLSLSPQYAIGGSVGYRYAKIGETKVNGNTIYNSDGSKYSIDYSGVFLRLEARVALTK